MIPAAYMPGPSAGSGAGSSPEAPASPADPSLSGQGGEEELCCPNCGLITPASELPDLLLPQIIEKISIKQKQLADLKEEVSQAKERWCDVVEAKRRLAEVWSKVLRARARVLLLEKVCDDNKKLSRKELEELQLLEKINKRRSERLRQVGSKDFNQKESKLEGVIAEDRSLASKRLEDLVVVRQRFVTELYQKVFPIEVLPLSNADAGGTDYYQRTEIDCDQILELEEGWVLGGVHSHPTPHISIVAPSLPANGDHTPYLHALSERTKSKGGVMQEVAVHPLNDPYLSTPAALLYIAHFIEVMAWVLDQPLPFPLRRPIAISVYGNPVKRKRAFLESMSKLDDNIMYLCFSQNVPPTALAPGHTLQNLLALVTHSELGRTGPFECYPELISYKGSFRGTRATRVSPMSHDIDDSQPPNVSYTGESVHSSTESEEEGEGEGDVSDALNTQMDWEHLEPSAEEMRLFEEEQMKLALAVSPTTDRVTVAHKHAQEVECYRQRLRRLDYNTTYMDYAAHTVCSSPHDSTRLSSTDSTLGSSGEGRSVGGVVGTSAEAGTATGTSPTQQGVASGILGTLSSLWTSTFGGSRS